ncbi:MAG: decaprenyl-phosphate phosphoribosyltransferase [Chitinivibrionales bacterium]|nr:decaprenyl-phosphate phosphoribosyltransferase [Chitinivibrionales bacterium]
MTMFKHLIISLRPWQWVKNSFVLAPLIFTNQFMNIRLGLKFLAGFGVFSIFASTVYLINDIADREKDRAHPLKKNRPIAAGKLSVSFAVATAVIMLAVAIPLAYLVDKQFFVISLIYLGLNFAYSFGFKKLIIIDALCVALGFVFRIWAGTAIANVDPTAWITLSTFFLALFLVFGKRRGEMVHIDRKTYNPKTALMKYQPQFLDSVIIVVSTCAIMCYSLFALSGYAKEKFGTEYLIAGVPFVVYGIFRYFHLIYNEEKGADPTDAVLTDFPIQIAVVGWLVTMVAVIYIF